MTVTWEQLGYDAGESAVVRDMFLQEDLGQFAGDVRMVAGVRCKLAKPTVMCLQSRAMCSHGSAYMPHSCGHAHPALELTRDQLLTSLN